MKKAVKGMTYILICIAYIAVGLLAAFMISKSGAYPAGSKAMGYVYKGDVLYGQLKTGNFYPLFDTGWYNGTELLRYWAPLPIYILALCQALMGGNYFLGYLLFIVILYVLCALSWFVIGIRHKRPWMGAFIGVVWFFMPNNLYTLFVEGELSRALVIWLLPLLVSAVHDYLLNNKWNSLIAIIVCMALMTLCNFEFAVMIILAHVLFLIVYRLLNRQRMKIFNTFFAMLLGLMLTGIWSFAYLSGAGLNTGNSEQMKKYFQKIWVTLNPVLRITEGRSSIYFGLAAFLLIVFGCIFARRKSIAGFWTALLILLCTVPGMYGFFSKLSDKPVLWMLHFISIALCLGLYSFFIWDSLKKSYVYLFAFLLVLDTIPSMTLISGNLKNVAPEKRYETMAESTLIGEAKEITEQRLALLDLGTLESEGAYLVSRSEDGVKGVYGDGWNYAATEVNVSRMDEALEKGCYLYLFDRSIELGSDTVLIRVSQAYGGNDDIEKMDAAAARLDYELIDSNADYRLYHKDVNGSFGVCSKYSAIGIGTSASLMALYFPSIEETTDTNLNHYSYEKLSEYKTIYLAGFTCDDRETAENMILKLTRAGVKVVVLADGIPIDGESRLQTFAGVTCQSITFSNGYPQLDTIDGILHPDLFPDGYTNWKTVYMNGLDDVWGTTLDMDQKLDFIGTKDNDNFVFIGLNLTYHYALTQDQKIGELLSKALFIDGGDLPEREIIPIDIAYGKNEIRVESPADNVNITLAYYDTYKGSQKIYSKNNLTYVKSGTTIIKITYPCLYQGIAVSALTLVLTIVFLILTRRRADKKAKLAGNLST